MSDWSGWRCGIFRILLYNNSILVCGFIPAKKITLKYFFVFQGLYLILNCKSKYFSILLKSQFCLGKILPPQAWARALQWDLPVYLPCEGPCVRTCTPQKPSCPRTWWCGTEASFSWDPPRGGHVAAGTSIRPQTVPPPGTTLPGQSLLVFLFTLPLSLWIKASA